MKNIAKTLQPLLLPVIGWVIAAVVGWTTNKIQVANLTGQVTTMKADLAEVVRWKTFQEGRQEGLKIGRDWQRERARGQ